MIHIFSTIVFHPFTIFQHNMIRFLILLFYSIHLIQADPILDSNKTLEECPSQNNFDHCFEYVDTIKFYLKEWKLGRGTKRVIEMINDNCLDARVCFYNMQCIAASRHQENVIELCKKFEMDRFEVTDCIEKFVSNVYHKDNECVADYDYLSTNLTIQRFLFVFGKPCVLEIVNSTCSEKAVFYINTQYIRFMNTMTIPSPGDKCGSIYDRVTAMRCELELKSVKEDNSSVGMAGLFRDQYKNRTMERCTSLRKCMKDSCYFATNTLEEDRQICDMDAGTNSTNRNFIECYFHIALDITNDPLDLGSISYMETVMKEECGEGAVKDFEGKWKRNVLS
ncbi:unnamed protein product [Caenorhabditis brenneri]